MQHIKCIPADACFYSECVSVCVCRCVALVCESARVRWSLLCPVVFRSSRRRDVVGRTASVGKPTRSDRLAAATPSSTRRGTAGRSGRASEERREGADEADRSEDKVTHLCSRFLRLVPICSASIRFYSLRLRWTCHDSCTFSLERAPTSRRPAQQRSSAFAFLIPLRDVD